MTHQRSQPNARISYRFAYDTPEIAEQVRRGFPGVASWGATGRMYPTMIFDPPLLAQKAEILRASLSTPYTFRDIFVSLPPAQAINGVTVSLDHLDFAAETGTHLVLSATQFGGWLPHPFRKGIAPRGKPTLFPEPGTAVYFHRRGPLDRKQTDPIRTEHVQDEEESMEMCVFTEYDTRIWDVPDNLVQLCVRLRCPLRLSVIFVERIHPPKKTAGWRREMFRERRVYLRGKTPLMPLSSPPAPAP